MIGIASIEPPVYTGPTSFEAIVAGRGNRTFNAVLNKAAQDQDREAVRQAAAQLVSSTFIMPVLQAMHDSPFLEPPFAPGYAEKRFQPLLDQQVADRLTNAARFPLIDVIVERLMGPARPSETPDTAS